MLSKFLQWFLFGFTMFAAGAPAIGGSDGSPAAGSDAVSDSSADVAADNADVGLEESADGSDGALSDESLESDAGEGSPDKTRLEDKDGTADLKGLVSRRLVALKKEAPEIAQLFQKYPKVQDQIEASFRKSMAVDELGGLPAYRILREQFPNGMADVEELLSKVGEGEQLDQNFIGRDAQGKYAGHEQMVKDMFDFDPTAAKALFREIPKFWARLDREGYNEVIGGIVGVTLANIQAPRILQKLSAGLKDNPQLKEIADELLEVVSGFTQAKPEPTEAERKLQQREENFRKEQDTRKADDQKRFSQSFFSESSKLQQSIIRTHPAIKELLTAKNIPEAKKLEIIKKIQEAGLNHLKTSLSWKRKLGPEYKAGNLEKALQLQKAQWSYPWFLNKHVRAILAQETPNLVVRQQRKPVTSTTTTKPVSKPTTQRAERTGPYQENGQWFKKDGSKFTMSEILRGAHLTAK